MSSESQKDNQGCVNLIGTVCVFFANIIISSFLLKPYIASQFYKWFILKLFPLWPVFGIIEFAGIALFVDVFSQINVGTKKSRSEVESGEFIVNFGLKTSIRLLLLFIGYIFHLIIG